MSLQKWTAGIKHFLASRAEHRKKYNDVGLTWLRVKQLKHSETVQNKTYTLQERTVQYRNGPDLLHTVEELFVHGLYKAPLGPQPYILDCGANIGLSVLYFAQHHPDAHIIAFEPDPVNFDLLTQNVAGLHAAVTLRQEAVWVREETLSFQADGGMGSHIAAAGSQNALEVKAVRLRDFLDRPVALLKMDIEGAEYAVFMDIRDRLHMVERCFLEYHGSFAQQDELVALFQVIREAGFSFYIKEALNVYNSPFARDTNAPFDVQLNIFCFRDTA